MGRLQTTETGEKEINRLALIVAICSIYATASNMAIAGNNRTGAEVVKEICAKCHAQGEKGAPKIGDVTDWSSRMSQGIEVLADHSVRGFSDMPARGRESKLTDLEMTRAIVYMLDPKSDASANMNTSMVEAKISGGKLYNMHCSKCHAAGVDGAPRSDDFKAWGARLSNGTSLVDSAIAGHNKMPSRGGMSSISDEEIKDAAIHMISLSVTSYAKQQAKAMR